ncbi:MAG: hypothetical protein WC807_11150 [Hyphomicrobium sp.]|jgi:hypothetical protein
MPDVLVWLIKLLAAVVALKIVAIGLSFRFRRIKNGFEMALKLTARRD